MHLRVPVFAQQTQHRSLLMVSAPLGDRDVGRFAALVSGIIAKLYVFQRHTALLEELGDERLKVGLLMMDTAILESQRDV